MSVTLEEIFFNDACTCGDSISQEHVRGKCYALEFNGVMWIGCSCDRIRKKKFTIKSEFIYETPIPVNPAKEVRTETKPVQSIQQANRSFSSLASANRIKSGTNGVSESSSTNSIATNSTTNNKQMVRKTSFTFRRK